MKLGTNLKKKRKKIFDISPPQLYHFKEIL